MRHTEFNIRISLLFFIVSIVFFTGCEESISSGNKNNSTLGKLYDTYITIALNTLAEKQTRTNPTGGEEGDGSEAALENENTIENLTVILYTGSGINNSLTTKITTAFYVGSEDILGGNTTRVQKIELDKDIYRLIVIANAGDLTYKLKGKTVKEVADYIQRSAWTVVNGTYSNFVMTSAEDATVDLTVSTDPANPAFVEVDVQRMASRIDILPNQGNGGSNIYSIIENNQTIANVTVNRAKLINKLIVGSYLLKRVAITPDGVPTYLGSETPTAGNQTNYVLDPWITLKTAENLTGNHFNIETGGAGVNPATALYINNFDSNFTLEDRDSIRSPLNGENFYILDYTLENTMGKDYQINGYSTGIMYQTTYLPLLITSYNPNNGSNEIITNNDIITFFATGPNNVIYNSLESIENIYVTGTQENDFFAQTFTPGNTWQEVSEYAKRIKDEDPLGFKVYLNNLLTNKVLTDNLNQSISWNAFVLSTYGYSYQNGTFEINQNGLDTKVLLSEQGIKTYEDGICYYTYWIRHSNDNTIESAIMEFGIVRNNIYKLRIASFSALGKPEPYDPDTDNPENPDEESYIRIVISVRPWRLITYPEIIL